MTSFGFTHDSFIQSKGRNMKEFIVVKTSLTKELWRAWWFKPGYDTSLDDLVQIFRQATVSYAWVFSLEQNDRAPSNNILVLTSMRLLEQLKTTRISILDGENDVDSENESNDEESESGESDSNDDEYENDTGNIYTSANTPTEKDLGGTNINSNTLNEEVTQTEATSPKAKSPSRKRKLPTKTPQAKRQSSRIASEDQCQGETIITAKTPTRKSKRNKGTTPT